MNSIWQTSSGISGTFAASFGTTFSGNGYEIACEGGTVAVSGHGVTANVVVHKGDQRDNNIILKKDFPDRSNGVEGEVAAWAKGIAEGKPDPMQSPEQALADLELLEQMLVSGEKGGVQIKLEHQI